MVDSAYILKEHEIAKIHCFKQISAVESLKHGTVVPFCTSKGGLIDVWCLGTSTTARQAISATMYVCTFVRHAIAPAWHLWTYVRS